MDWIYYSTLLSPNVKEGGALQSHGYRQVTLSWFERIVGCGGKANGKKIAQNGET